MSLISPDFPVTLCKSIIFPQFFPKIAGKSPVVYDFRIILPFILCRSFFILANSVDHDEMRHIAAFHLDHHCL